MDMETLKAAKKLEHEIEYISGILRSIDRSGLKIEYLKDSDNGLIPDRVPVDGFTKDLIITHLKERLDKTKADLEAL
jgi:hypothetical protein